MKIIIFQGGLGNQIFQYYFYLFLKNKFPDRSIYGYYSSKSLKNQHNGLEIDNVFEAKLPKSNFLVFILISAIRLLDKLKLRKIGNQDVNFEINSIVFNGFFQDKKFYDYSDKQIKFKDVKLSNENRIALKKIQETNSVSIHIRRGDYLYEKYFYIYGNICTVDYYQMAISIIKKELFNPYFYIFSDDICWVKENLMLENAEYITWNNGRESYLDMFLMSNCKSNIIANSSFSFWGASLNVNDNPLVIYPKKWFNSTYKAPDIFPNSWEGIE